MGVPCTPGRQGREIEGPEPWRGPPGGPPARLRSSWEGGGGGRAAEPGEGARGPQGQGCRRLAGRPWAPAAADRVKPPAPPLVAHGGPQPATAFSTASAAKSRARGWGGCQTARCLRARAGQGGRGRALGAPLAGPRRRGRSGPGGRAPGLSAPQGPPGPEPGGGHLLDKVTHCGTS